LTNANSAPRSRRRPGVLPLPVWLVLSACAAEPPRVPETEEQRTSYAIGLHLGMRLREMRADLDPERITNGFASGLAAAPDAAGSTDEQEIRVELARLATSTADLAREARSAAARRNARASEEFLATNRLREGVVELPSGVQYRVVADGDEPPPSLGDRITVEYEGRLLDGSIFDASRDRFAPTIVRLNRTPAAWREVLTQVESGATVEIWVPGRIESDERPVGLVAPGELVAFTIRVTAIDRHGNPEVARAPP
jgi:FKBP-type peptidyl-prolyl cis-trans isomerase FklB